MSAGRPTTYSKELADYVCHIIATHPYGLKKLTRMYERFPSQSTIYAWMYEHKEFSGQYFEARKAQAAVLADSMLEIPEDLSSYEDKEGNKRIDSGMLGKAKLEYEIKKWHASKMAPRMFGDLKELEALKSENAETKKELEMLRQQLAEQYKKEY